MSTPVLHFKSLNQSASRTLLLIHGAMSSHHEFDIVSQTTHLSSYHLLIPDLPSHGLSSAISFNIPDTAALLADLVAKEAKNGKADIAGMSLGGYTAIYAAQKYPNIIGAGGLFVSGCEKTWGKVGSWRTWVYGLTMTFSAWLLTHLPNSISEWVQKKAGLKVSPELYKDMKAAATIRMGQIVMNALAEDMDPSETRGWVGRFENTKMRTCIVAGILDDDEKACLERGKGLRVGNPESRAFKVEGKRHAWDIQDPELFARGIKAWMDRELMPEEFLALD